MHTDVVLVRHAQSIPPTADGLDELARPLAAGGLRQALELVDTLTKLWPVAVWSSPYRRAIQTVEPTALALGLPVRTRWELREWTTDSRTPTIGSRTTSTVGRIRRTRGPRVKA